MRTYQNFGVPDTLESNRAIYQRTSCNREIHNNNVIKYSDQDPHRQPPE